MDEILQGLRERISNCSITALYPSMRYLLDNTFDGSGFINEESAEFFEEVLALADKFAEMGDPTGITHYVLYLGLLVKGGMAEQEGDEALVNEYIQLIDYYINKSIELDFNLAYCDFGKTLFLGNGIWEQDQEKGLALMKRSLELPVIPELGVEAEYVDAMLNDCYNECLAQYSESKKQEEVYTKQSKQDAPVAGSISTSEKKKPTFKKRKDYTAGYYQAGFAAFIGYILVSILLRVEFGWQSAYDISITTNPVLGVGAALLLNYSVIAVLLMAYFYKQDNGKHSIPLVALYIIFLVAAYVDGMLPYIQEGTLFDGTNLINALMYPTIFLVAHRLLSLLIYAVLRTKEGESDYKIYYGIVLFAPFMAWIFVIAIGYWIFTACSGSSDGGYQSAGASSSVDMKEYVHRELSVGIRTYGVYYDDGWKVVDYWNNGSKLSQFQGDDWRQTYFKDSDGKVYILSTNCPDKETIYYFS